MKAFLSYIEHNNDNDNENNNNHDNDDDDHDNNNQEDEVWRDLISLKWFIGFA